MILFYLRQLLSMTQYILNYSHFLFLHKFNLRWLRNSFLWHAVADICCLRQQNVIFHYFHNLPLSQKLDPRLNVCTKNNKVSSHQNLELNIDMNEEQSEEFSVVKYPVQSSLPREALIKQTSAMIGLAATGMPWLQPILKINNISITKIKLFKSEGCAT